MTNSRRPILSPSAGRAEKFRHLIFSALSGVSAPAWPRRGRTTRPSSARARLPDSLGLSRYAGRIVRFPNRPIPQIFRAFYHAGRVVCRPDRHSPSHRFERFFPLRGVDRSHTQPPPSPRLPGFPRPMGGEIFLLSLHETRQQTAAYPSLMGGITLCNRQASTNST